MHKHGYSSRHFLKVQFLFFLKKRNFFSAKWCKEPKEIRSVLQGGWDRTSKPNSFSFFSGAWDHCGKCWRILPCNWQLLLLAISMKFVLEENCSNELFAWTSEEFDHWANPVFQQIYLESASAVDYFVSYVSDVQ